MWGSAVPVLSGRFQWYPARFKTEPKVTKSLFLYCEQPTYLSNLYRCTTALFLQIPADPLMCLVWELEWIHCFLIGSGLFWRMSWIKYLCVERKNKFGKCCQMSFIEYFFSTLPVVGVLMVCIPRPSVYVQWGDLWIWTRRDGTQLPRCSERNINNSISDCHPAWFHWIFQLLTLDGTLSSIMDTCVYSLQRIEGD